MFYIMILYPLIAEFFVFCTNCGAERRRISTEDHGERTIKIIEFSEDLSGYCKCGGNEIRVERNVQ